MSKWSNECDDEIDLRASFEHMLRKQRERAAGKPLVLEESISFVHPEVLKLLVEDPEPGEPGDSVVRSEST